MDNTECPLGLYCPDMGLNPSGFCTNKGKCSAIAQTLHDETHPNPDAIDALEYENPYISCNWYERGVDTYWTVLGNKKLPPGYAVAEDARLPWIVKEGLEDTPDAIAQTLVWLGTNHG